MRPPHGNGLANRVECRSSDILRRPRVAPRPRCPADDPRPQGATAVTTPSASWMYAARSQARNAASSATLLRSPEATREDRGPQRLARAVWVADERRPRGPLALVKRSLARNRAAAIGVVS
jgi:hypothetical protein